jgi:ATP-dependent HslUV protease, peptidase subunit HslV
MSTVTVVRKGGIGAICADTLTKWGTVKETADYVHNHEKIVQVGESYLGLTGPATFKLILRDYFAETGNDSRLDSVANIFRVWNRLHRALKDRYFLLPEEDKEDALESSRVDVLILNRHGIFGVAAHRTVQEFSRFYAFGSGSDYALGAMFCLYDQPSLSAEDIAKRAIEAAAQFDDSTGLPLQCHTVKLTSN